MKHRLFVAVALALLFGFGASTADARVLARVGRAAITDKAVRDRVQQLLPQISFHRRLTATLKKKLRKIALKQLIDEELLLSEALRLKLWPTKKMVETARKAQIKRAGGQAKFARKLKKYKLSWQDHWKGLSRRLAVASVLAKVVVRPAQVTDKIARAYYKKNTFKFKRPPEAQLQQITWLVKPNAAPAVWKKAGAAAAVVRGKLTKGTSFRTIAVGLAHHKKDEIKVEEHGWVHKMRLGKTLDAVAFKLKKGEVSKPIRTLYGYVLLRCYGRRAGRLLTFAQAKKKLKLDLLKKNAKARHAALIKRLRARLKVSVP